jgi:nucleotidyltransferase/DNA polymerase involved in DNA repair
MKTDLLTARGESLRELRTIPGIGPSLALDLYSLGIRRVADLKTKDPEKLYRQLERLTASKQDRCVLYTFRCAVYFAKTKKPERERLLWWNWKDEPTKKRPRSTRLIPRRRSRA